MKQLQKLYQKYNNCITKWIFPVILLLYPLVKINQGVDVSDSTYSLGNYLFFPQMEGTWVVSTYLSNLIGWLMTKLPFADRLLVMNLYTGLIVSGLALFLYHQLRKWMPEWIVFTGEVVAIGFLWIPTGILYNYLTYVLFSMGAIFLYKGITEEKDRFLVIAGVLLGLNVWVRIPNLAEMALIVSLWYYCYLRKEKIKTLYASVWKYVVRKTAVCIAGYATGVLVPLAMIVAQYGFSGIVDMVSGLSQIQGSDDTYSVLSMIGAAMDAYVRTGKWVAFILIGIFMGVILFYIKKGWMQLPKKLIYLLGIAVLLRFLWGRGMFSFRYYEDYTSMYEWGMIGLYLALIACIYLLFGKGVSVHERVWGMLSLVIICITPLGSNNYTYQNLNNLFLTAPVTVYAFVKLYRRKYPDEKNALMFPWKAMVAALACMIFVQSVGFHFGFVFRDGMDGTLRDTEISGAMSVAGMRTTKENAEELGGLLAFMEAEKTEGMCSVYFGDCPGISYLLQMPAAIGTTWPDLDSNPVAQFEESLLALEDRPVIIIRHIESESPAWIAKKEMLVDYITGNQYDVSYQNNGYTVYQPVE